MLTFRDGVPMVACDGCLRIVGPAIVRDEPFRLNVSDPPLTAERVNTLLFRHGRHRVGYMLLPGDEPLVASYEHDGCTYDIEGDECLARFKPPVRPSAPHTEATDETDAGANPEAVAA